MFVLQHFILAYTMFFSGFNGNIFVLHRFPFENSTRKYVISGGYTSFGIPFTRMSVKTNPADFNIFLLSSGKMTRTDAQGQNIGSFYYNSLMLSATKGVFNDSTQGLLFVEPSLYIESSDGWYNPGLGFSLFYERKLYRKLMMNIQIRNLGLSFNPVNIINFQGDLVMYYAIFGVNPHIALDYTPTGGINYWVGAGLPLNKIISVYVSYTDKYSAMRFGAGGDLLNGLSLGLSLSPSFLQFNYFVDFYGEGGITHYVEVRFSK